MAPEQDVAVVVPPASGAAGPGAAGPGSGAASTTGEPGALSGVPGTVLPRRVVLVTGMSGTGKSTVLGELARRGHRVVDSDEAGWVVPLPTDDGPEPGWDLDRVRAAVEGHRAGWLFVAGCVANQGALHDRFDAVVLLSAPLEVLLARVADRPNPFGSTPGDRARIADDHARVEPLLRAGASHEVVTTAPLGDVVARLEQVAATAGRR